MQNIDDLIEKASTRLMDYKGDDEIITSLDMQDIIRKKPVLKTFNSKIPSLDMAINGFEPGEVIAVSGPTKGGKTLFGQTLTVNFEQQDVKSLWFSYELTARQFLDRFDEIPFFLLPKKLKPYALDWLQERILEAIVKHGIQVVFIDHLHFLFDMAQARNASIEIGQIIRWLKTLALELNIVIFILCHFQKISLDREPDHTNIRDSSFISQESDTGLILWRIRNKENRACLKVCYSRRTGVLEKKIPIVKIDKMLREVADE